MASATTGLDKLPLKLSGQITMCNPMDVLELEWADAKEPVCVEAGQANPTLPCHKPPQVERVLLQ
jgi:hypothetical protein